MRTGATIGNRSRGLALTALGFWFSVVLLTPAFAAPVTLKILTTMPSVKTAFADLQKKLPSDLSLEVVVTDPMKGGYKNYYDEFNKRTYDLIVGAIFPEWISNSEFTSLDSYIQSSKLALPTVFTNRMRYGGKLYDLPVAAMPYVVVYNMDLFDQHDVGYPQPGWTWNEFRRIANILTDRDGDHVRSFGATIDLNTWPVVAYESGLGLLEFNDTLLSTSLELLTSMIQNDQSIYYRPTAPKPKDNLGKQWAFGLGNVAMQVRRLDEILSLNKLDKQTRWGIALLPLFQGEGATFTSFFSGAISASSRHQKESWQVLNLLVGAEGQRSLAAYATMPFTFTRSALDTFTGSISGKVSGVECLQDAKLNIVDRGQSQSLSNSQKEFWDTMISGFTSVLQGDETPDQVIAKLRRIQSSAQKR